MGHYVTVRSYNYDNGSEKTKKLIEAELNEFATYNGDYHSGLDKKIQWTSREFESFDDAQEWLENHEGFYWQGAAKYKHYASISNAKSERLQKKIDELNQKLAKTKADMMSYVEKNNVKNRKSVYVGCPNCGSKLHKDYIPIQMYSQNCPLCHTDLFSETVKKRILSYKTQINDLEKQITETKKDKEKAKNSGKFTWMWAVKIEFHC